MTNRDSYTNAFIAGFLRAWTNYTNGGTFWEATDAQIIEMAEASFADMVVTEAVSPGSDDSACPDCGYDVPQPAGSHRIVVVGCGVDRRED